MRLSFSILLLMASFWWICRYGGYNGKLASHISLSQRPDPQEKQVISLDQDVQVCGYFWWMVDETPSYEFSLPCIYIYIFLVWAIFSLSVFLTCLVGMWHTFFGYASFFCIARIFDGNLEKESHVMAWSFIECMDGCACYLPVWKYSM